MSSNIVQTILGNSWYNYINKAKGRITSYVLIC